MAELKEFTNLEAPSLVRVEAAIAQLSDDPIVYWTDESLFATTGVRIAFTERSGGASTGDFASLNLSAVLGDDEAAMSANRSALMSLLGAEKATLINPIQVHGTDIISVGCKHCVPDALEQAAAGADAIVCSAENVFAMLLFADCCPVIIVSPSGRFALAHAGWRGAVADIAGKTARALYEADLNDPRFMAWAETTLFDAGVSSAAMTLPSRYNAYIGPRIGFDHFQAGADVCEQFVSAFGADIVCEDRIDLAGVVSIGLERVGLDPARIYDMDVCTMCNPDRFFSYRVSGGACGRHAACAVRMEPEGE